MGHVGTAKKDGDCFPMQALDRLTEMISKRISPRRMGWQGQGEQGEQGEQGGQGEHNRKAMKVNISEAVRPNRNNIIFKLLFSSSLVVLIVAFAFVSVSLTCRRSLILFLPYSFVDSTGCLLFSFAPPLLAALLPQPPTRIPRPTLPRLSCTRTSTRSCSLANMVSLTCTRSLDLTPSLPRPQPAQSCRRAALPLTTPTTCPSTVSSNINFCFLVSISFSC